MKDLEQNIYALWKFLRNKGMIGSTKHTDKPGRERVRYFLNNYGVRIFNLMRERYKLGGVENVDDFFANDTSTKVLIVCPFCGGKTEQGLLKCQKCGADLWGRLASPSDYSSDQWPSTISIAPNL